MAGAWLGRLYTLMVARSTFSIISGAPYNRPMKNDQPNFGYLLLGLCVLWLGMPILRIPVGEYSQVLSYVIFGAALCVAAWSVLKEPQYFLIAGLIIVLWFLGASAAYFMDSAWLRFSVIGLQLTFWSLAALLVSRFVLSSGPVDTNRIFAGVCLYLIAGIIWAMVYAMFDQLLPGSLMGIDTDSFNGRISNILYFSFVTLTTLGYGDIVPVHPVMRAFVQVEAVFGQLYVAILISSLVGIRLSGHRQRNDSDN